MLLSHQMKKGFSFPVHYYYEKPAMTRASVFHAKVHVCHPNRGFMSLSEKGGALQSCRQCGVDELVLGAPQADMSPLSSASRPTFMF